MDGKSPVWTVDEQGAAPGPACDPLRRGVQAALALYLAPVVLIVLLVGGIATLLLVLARLVGFDGVGPRDRSAEPGGRAMAAAPEVISVGR